MYINLTKRKGVGDITVVRESNGRIGFRVVLVECIERNTTYTKQPAETWKTTSEATGATYIVRILKKDLTSK